MSERALKQLVGALAVVVALWLIMVTVSGGSGGIEAAGAVTHFFDGVDAESVEGVSLSRTDGTVELERQGASWTVNGFPADSAVVAQMLDALADASVGDLAASNPANHDRMGVSGDSAVTMTLRLTAEEARILLVGDAGARFGTAYVRLPDADEVYVLEADLRAQIRRDEESWRDRRMVAIDSAAVARIEVDHDGDSYALVRGDSAWSFEEGGAVEGPAIDGLLAELAGMVATGFLTEDDSIAGLELASTTTAYSADGATLARVTIGEGETDRWARTDSDRYLYRISSFRAGRVAPSRENAQGGGEGGG